MDFTHSFPPSPFPSYETRQAAQDWTHLTPEANCIKWTLNGPFQTAIWVMPHFQVDVDNPAHDTPYCIFDENGIGPPIWHAISQAPFTHPPISSVRIRVESLDEWEYNWSEKHGLHSAYNEGNPGFTECCGTRVPSNMGAELTVRAIEGEFVTVHDFLATVHPYLMYRRKHILAAMAEDPRYDPSLKVVCRAFPDGLRYPPRRGAFAANTKLMVDIQTPVDLDVTDEAQWLVARTT
ncbi:hypothetical protein OQA88_4651 [Cercophora sp. LCS_1]